MFPLPPDLSRLGDELPAAVGRARDERRRRRRLLARICASALSGIFAMALLAPAALNPELRLAAPFAQEAAATVLARPPDRPPVQVASEVTDYVLVRPPDRRPLPPVVVRRDA
jgi:hypothetical protein